MIHPEVHRGKAESITSTTITDSLHIRDVLPKGLSCIPEYSYWGGTYQQVGEGKQGNILNGTHLPDPVIQSRPDGLPSLNG